ncbi:LacI family DNA-binding transcriptional regulator [Kitasatospora purpeofusca]|uniref:LacI family DNA-binding transcriptional regulator n=1 Tax=Kitasatospora purpeofusca TaxID=67352 RepID=UPI0038656A7F|nr:LacI family transcriptional regulator [Kitasatospora purpeofusca]
MEQEKIGITEVAQHAGVSVATVSRVLNRKAGVSQKTRQLVERAMEEVGYERGAASGGIVGVITPGLSIPIFGVMAERIGLALAPHGLRAVVCPALPGGVQERDFLKSLLDLGASGIVFCSASNTLENFDPEVLQLLEHRPVPYVCINGRFEDSSSVAFSTDDAYAAELSVRHLHGLGHRRIAMAAGPVGNRPTDRRVAGYRSAMTALGLGEDEQLVVHQTYSVEGGQFAAEQLLARGVTGIVAASDQMALGAIRAIRRQGLSVPEDISVIGYDDGPLMEFTDPPLTTVRQPVDRLAAEVARALVGLLAGHQVPVGELMFQPEVVVRGTTAPHRPRRPPA